MCGGRRSGGGKEGGQEGREREGLLELVSARHDNLRALHYSMYIQLSVAVM